LNWQFESEINEKEKLKLDYEREIAHLKKQLKAGEDENKKLLDTLIWHSKGEEVHKPKEEFAPGSAAAIFRSS
jgi:hypothetical protein